MAKLDFDEANDSEIIEFLKDDKNHQNFINKQNDAHKYHQAYFHFINFFAEKEELIEQDLFVGANFAYGWMPTILNFKSEEYVVTVELLNKAKTERLIRNDLDVLKGLINNSIVGVSKLLHFINPELYPIWDSRVCYYLAGRNDPNTVNHIGNYMVYMDFCDRLINKYDKDVKTLSDALSKGVLDGKRVSSLRALELFFFINGKDGDTKA